MPYGNRMGPDGRGQRTGRGMGLCTGNDKPGCHNKSGFSVNRGGMGNGRCGTKTDFSKVYRSNCAKSRFTHDFRSSGSIDEMEFLKNQSEYLESELGAVNERIKVVENSMQEKE